MRRDPPWSHRAARRANDTPSAQRRGSSPEVLTRWPRNHSSRGGPRSRTEWRWCADADVYHRARKHCAPEDRVRAEILYLHGHPIVRPERHYLAPGETCLACHRETVFEKRFRKGA